MMPGRKATDRLSDGLPRARGREYSMVIFVPSMIWDTEPISLARICAPADDAIVRPSAVPVATQSRPMLPVLGAIWGWRGATLS